MAAAAQLVLGRAYTWPAVHAAEPSQHAISWTPGHHDQLVCSVNVA